MTVSETITDEMVERGARAHNPFAFEKMDDDTYILEDIARDSAKQEVREILTAALSDQAGGEPYLVWSNQHRAWWRANSYGYTNDVRSAGLYDREEAISISGQGRDGWLEPKKAPDELAIPLSALPKNIRAMIAAAPSPSSTAGE